VGPNRIGGGRCVGSAYPASSFSETQHVGKEGEEITQHLEAPVVPFIRARSCRGTLEGGSDQALLCDVPAWLSLLRLLAGIVPGWRNPHQFMRDGGDARLVAKFGCMRGLA
jgi:hypothetical protein